jgi:hypothetical protein
MYSKQDPALAGMTICLGDENSLPGTLSGSAAAVLVGNFPQQRTWDYFFESEQTPPLLTSRGQTCRFGLFELKGSGRGGQPGAG